MLDNVSVTQIAQGKEIGCRKYVLGRVRQRSSYVASWGGDLFQKTVNSVLVDRGVAVKYRDFLEELGIEVKKELPPINSPEVLQTIYKNREQLKKRISEIAGKKLYLYPDIEIGGGEKGIPVKVTLSKLMSILPHEEKVGYFDLVYLAIEKEKLVFGGGEIKLAEKPRFYHYDQLIIYLYFLLMEIKHLNLSLDVSRELELFLPDPKSRKGFISIRSELSDLEESFEIIREKLEKINSYAHLPVSEECLICGHLDECVKEAIRDHVVSAYKTLRSKRESLFEEGCETADKVDKRKKELWEELQLIPDIVAYERERTLVKEKGFWDRWRSGEWDLPEVVRYREKVKSVLHPFRTFLSIFAMPSAMDIFDVLLYAVSVITLEPEKVKKALEKEGINVEFVRLGKLAGNDYYAISFAAYKASRGADVSRIFRSSLASLLRLYSPRSDEKGHIKSETGLFIGFVDRGSWKVTERNFERSLLDMSSGFPRLEKIFAGLNLRDDNTLYYYYRGSGTIVTELLPLIYMTNEPFIFGYPSLIALYLKVVSESKNFSFDPRKVPCTLLKIEEKNRLSKYPGSPVEIDYTRLTLNRVFRSVASPVAIVDHIKLEEAGFLKSGEGYVRSAGYPLEYFPLLAFLTVFNIFADLRFYKEV